MYFMDIVRFYNDHHMWFIIALIELQVPKVKWRMVAIHLNKLIPEYVVSGI